MLKHLLIKIIERWNQYLYKRRVTNRSKGSLRMQGLDKRWPTFSVGSTGEFTVRSVHYGGNLPDGLRERWIVDECVTGTGQVLTIHEAEQYQAALYLTRESTLSPSWTAWKTVGPHIDKPEVCRLLKDLARQLELATRFKYSRGFL